MPNKEKNENCLGSPINWFPGHMTKSYRSIEDNIKNIDVVLCVLDARAPYSCINRELESKLNGKTIIYILSKSDLADNQKTKLWIEYFKSQNKLVTALKSSDKSTKKQVLELVKVAIKNKLEKQKNKQIKLKNRVCIIGVPNTGKSTILNTLAGSYVAKTGNIAGVTRSSSWIKIENNIELMDNAGTLYPKFKNAEIAENLAFLGSVSDNVLDFNELAVALIKKLVKIAPTELKNRYNLESLEKSEIEIIEDIAKKRGFVLKKGEIDFDRCSSAIIDDFRKTRIGKITLEVPSDIERYKSNTIK